MSCPIVHECMNVSECTDPKNFKNCVIFENMQSNGIHKEKVQDDDDSLSFDSDGDLI